MNNQFDVTLGELLQRASKIGRVPSRLHRFLSVNNTTKHNLTPSLSDCENDNSNYPGRSTRIVGGNHGTLSDNSNITIHKGKDVNTSEYILNRRNTLKDHFKCKRSYLKRKSSFSNSGNRANSSNGTNTTVTNHFLNIQNTETGADDSDEDVVVSTQDSGCARTNLVRDKSNPKRGASIFINDNLFESCGSQKNFKNRASQVLNNNRNNNMGISDRKRSMTDYQWLLEDGMDDLFENFPCDGDVLGLRPVQGRDHDLIGLEENNEPFNLKYVREVNKSEPQNNLMRKPFSSMSSNSQNSIGNSQKEYEFKYFRKIERNGETKEKSILNNTGFKRSSSKRKIRDKNIGVIRTSEEFGRNSQQELIGSINSFSSSLPGSQLLGSLPSSSKDIDKDEGEFVSLHNEKYIKRASKTQFAKTSTNEVPTITQMPFEKISQQELIGRMNSFPSSLPTSQILGSLPSSNREIDKDEMEFVSLHNEKYIKRTSKTQVSKTAANEVPTITQMPFEKISQQEPIGGMNMFSSSLLTSQILGSFPSSNTDIDKDEVEFVSSNNEKYIKRALQTQLSTTPASEVSTMARMPFEKISKQELTERVNSFSSSLPASQILGSFPSSNRDIDKEEGHNEKYIQRTSETKGSITSANGVPPTLSISDGNLSNLSKLPLGNAGPNSTNINIDNNQVEIASLCNDRCIKCGFSISNSEVPPITQTPSISDEKPSNPLEILKNSEGIEMWNSDMKARQKVLNTGYNDTVVEVEADTITEEKVKTSTKKVQILENIVLKNEYEWYTPAFPQQNYVLVDPLMNISKEGDNIRAKTRKLSRNIKERHILKANFTQNSWDEDEGCQSPGKVDYQTDVEYLRSFLEDKLQTITRYLYRFQNNLEGTDNNQFNNTILNGLNNPNEDTLLKDLESQDIFSQSFTFTPILVDRSKIKCSQTSISQCEQVDRPNDDMFSRSIEELLKDPSLISKGVYDVRIPGDVKKMFILRKISDTFIKLLDDVRTQRVPMLCSKYHGKDKLRNFDENKMMIVPFVRSRFSKICLGNRHSRSKFNLVVFLMGKSADLLINNNFSTKRELYYQIKSFVRNQEKVNSAVMAISMLLDEPPWDFGILGASKGLVYGDLIVTLSEKEVVNCNIRGGSLIPQDVMNITKLESNASFILVVEKDTIFQKLLDENLANTLPKSFILVTGKGFADFNTSLFIKKLWQILYIPVFILVDADPYGIEIMLTYRFGSAGSPHLSDYLAIPSSKWIGVHPKDIIPLNIVRQPLTENDKKKIRSILARPYINFVPKIKEELEVMLANNFKAEIEGIMKGNNYLGNYYIPTKICTKDFL